MLLNFEQFAKEIVPGKVLYFSCEDLGTFEPHFFVCIVRQPDDIYILSCATSKLETMRRLVERKRFPNETIVYIPSADETNPFSLDTYINCNEYFPFAINELWDLYTQGELTIRGNIAFESLHQIIIGFHSSPVVELELKDLLPDPDDM
jgi:hypothetical protein